MISTIFVFAAVLVSALAGPIDHHGASSYSSFNQDHSSVQHIGSAPALLKAAPVYSAPAYHTQAYSAPAYTKAYAAPVAKVALPVVKAVPVVKYAAPVAHYAHAPSHYDHEEKYAPAQYEFSYAVQDSHTGDFHSQEEHRDGDHVVGQYSLHEADGTIRIVKYFDDGHGFQATVEKQGEPTPAPAQYKKVVVPVAKGIVAAPHY